MLIFKKNRKNITPLKHKDNKHSLINTRKSTVNIHFKTKKESYLFPHHLNVFLIIYPHNF